MRNLIRRRRILTYTASAVAVTVPSSAAHAWPDQPMRLVVPFTPAGGPDFIARFVGERLSRRLTQPVVVENLPGASGNIGSLQVARAKPDGLTIMSSVNTLVMNASLFRNLPYDPVSGFRAAGPQRLGAGPLKREQRRAERLQFVRQIARDGERQGRCQPLLAGEHAALGHRGADVRDLLSGSHGVGAQSKGGGRTVNLGFRLTGSNLRHSKNRMKPHLRRSAVSC